VGCIHLCLEDRSCSMLRRMSKKGTSTARSYATVEPLFDTNAMAKPGPKSSLLFVEFYLKEVLIIYSVLSRMPVLPVLIQWSIRYCDVDYRPDSAVGRQF
jgi:hypothetical protein